MKAQFNQLEQLELLRFNRCSNYTEINLDGKNKPEVIFLLANHNPGSSQLKTILSDSQIAKYGQSQRFDLKFFVSNFAGYGLHSDCMFSLDEFKERL